MFSNSESSSKISNLVITKLSALFTYQQSGSLHMHTRSFRHIQLSVFIYRLCGFARLKNVSWTFEKRARGVHGLVLEMLCYLLSGSRKAKELEKCSYLRGRLFFNNPFLNCLVFFSGLFGIRDYWVSEKLIINMQWINLYHLGMWNKGVLGDMQ